MAEKNATKNETKVARKNAASVAEKERIPVTISAAMRYLMETVDLGYRYYTKGVIPIEKAEALADKFAEKYGTRMTKGQRDWAKEKDRARCKLVMFPDNRDPAKAQNMLWWLLVTEGTGSVWIEEDLKDARRFKITLDRQFFDEPEKGWQPQYLLAYGTIPKAKGGGWGWTWRMSEKQKTQLQEKMRHLCNKARSSSSNNPHQAKTQEQTIRDRENKRKYETDKLLAFIEDLRGFPGFRGVRDDLRHIMHVGQRMRGSLPSDIRWNDIGIWIDKSLTVFRPGFNLENYVKAWQDLKSGGLPEKNIFNEGQEANKDDEAQSNEEYWRHLDTI